MGFLGDQRTVGETPWLAIAGYPRGAPATPQADLFGASGDSAASQHLNATVLSGTARSVEGATDTYTLVMQILYMAASGTSDPTRASIPLHLAVNGSLEIGHTVGIVLAGDATELLKTARRDETAGIGVPPVRELFAKAHQHEVPIYV